MDQLRDESLNVGGGFPRTRGDGPADQDWATVGYQLPPHARGWTAPLRGMEGLPGASPARAGMDLGLGNNITGLDALPPHARGWTDAVAFLGSCSVASPARAGMDRVVGPLDPVTPCFPRTRGDGPSAGKDVDIDRTVSPARAGMDQ